jgi:hypothetical protein
MPSISIWKSRRAANYNPAEILFLFLSESVLAFLLVSEAMFAIEGLGTRRFQFCVGFGDPGSIDKGIARIFKISPCLACVAFDLIFLPGDLQALVAHKRARRLFDSTANLLQHAFYLVVIHR